MPALPSLGSVLSVLLFRLEEYLGILLPGTSEATALPAGDPSSATAPTASWPTSAAWDQYAISA